MSVLFSTCLDERCRYRIVYPASYTTATCRGCGQTHSVAHFPEKTSVEDAPTKVQTLIKSLLIETQTPKRGPETIKVLGISNYHHKLLSPLLTLYGMDKHTGKARLLKELIKRPTLDCGVFGDRGFSIESRHLHITGYGRDQSGSASYLADTLALLLPYNDNKETLVPVHVDGDGHCLVHAVSRALVGRELFWHPLRVHLQQHFKDNLDTYKELLGDFINGSEWPCIIAECDPDFVPADGIVGLRPIHVFGLANILRRPILLLDSVAGMNTSADYAALFIPGLSPPELCRNKAGCLNPPLCLAWSSPARNHYIPLVPIKDSQLPLFPKHLLPKVWGLPQTVLELYLTFNENNCVIIGGSNCMQPAYMLRLTAAMDKLFHTKFLAPASLVADVYLYQYAKKTGVKMNMVVEETAAALQDRRLQRCLVCDAINILPLSEEWLRPRGFLYTLAKRQYGFLQEDRKYPFVAYGVTCTYNAKKDMLVIDSARSMDSCIFCHGKLRIIHNDGTVAYENGDVTNESVSNPATNHCPCGFKHWWKGIAYDNPPLEIPVVLQWNGVTVADIVHWFQYESQRHLNSNAYQIASFLLQKHFPGEFGSEHLHHSIVQQILDQVKDLPPPPKSPDPPEVEMEKEEACGGSTSGESVLPRVSPEPRAEASCSSRITKTSSAKVEDSGSLHPCPRRMATCPRPTYRVGPGMSMLSTTPVNHNTEAMERFLQLMRRKSPSPPAPDSPSPSTSKQ
uniref:OTU domain-containing protein n=1 Tax=Cuerna arida TaxID=1464854 RepID=A0A1B6F1W1_9HEMI